MLTDFLLLKVTSPRQQARFLLSPQVNNIITLILYCLSLAHTHCIGVFWNSLFRWNEPNDGLEFSHGHVMLVTLCYLFTLVAMPHPQQAAMMSQLPSNRQAMVAPTQPVYIIPQAPVTSGIPPTPSVAAAFQPTQFGKGLKFLIL